MYPRLNCSLNRVFNLSTYVTNTVPHGKSLYGVYALVGLYLTRSRVLPVVHQLVRKHVPYARTFHEVFYVSLLKAFSLSLIISLNKSNLALTAVISSFFTHFYRVQVYFTRVAYIYNRLPHDSTFGFAGFDFSFRLFLVFP